MKTKLILLSALLLIGCGSRKTQQTKTDVTTKEVATDNSVIETKTETNTKVVDCTSTDEIEIIPIDNTKEIVVNGKVYKNVSIKKKKTKNNLTIAKNEIVDKIEKKDVKTKSKAKVEVKQKATESNKGNFLNWIVLILVIIAFGYWFWWSRKIVRDKEKFEL
jgi:ATP-dependent Zn protease